MARDHRLDDEIQFHIEKQIEKNIRAGMSPDEARRDALVKFGGVERAREAARDEMRFAWFADFIRDLFHLCFGHGNVSLVFKVLGLVCIAAPGFTSDHTSKDSRRAGTCQGDLRQQIIQINLIFSDRENSWKIHVLSCSQCDPGTRNH